MDETTAPISKIKPRSLYGAGYREISALLTALANTASNDAVAEKVNVAYPHLLTSDFFHHKLSVTRITDIQPAVRDNGDLIGAVKSVPVSQDGPRNCPKVIFSAL
ncbi:MAG: hypothetical protein ACHQIK_18320 [Candidatus Acidiferrales bacterium]